MINRDYLYSNIYDSIDTVMLEPDSSYFYCYSVEERSHCADLLQKKWKSRVNFVGLENILPEDYIVDPKTQVKYLLRSSEQMKKLLEAYKSKNVYIDISGFNIRICASFLKNILELFLRSDINISIIYAEPKYYDVKAFKTNGYYYDLSEEIEGITPLPGFGRIIPERDNCEVFLIPLLGFEGGRFAHILENTPPLGKNIIPIIGVAGFRAEYPFVTYWGNQRPLMQSGSWEHAEYATANSLVDAFVALKKIYKDHPRSKLKIAPIGTKPHTIGAILFSIYKPDVTELIYDNPVRKKPRTTGVGNIVITSISKLMKEP